MRALDGRGAFAILTDRELKKRWKLPILDDNYMYRIEAGEYSI